MSGRGTRRRFLKQAGLTAGTLFVGRDASALGGGRVSILVDPQDAVASQPQARWAVEELRKALAEKGVESGIVSRLGEVDRSDLCVLVSGPSAEAARGVALAESAEALSLAPGTLEGRPVLFARARDARGFVYALLELADVVRHSGDPVGALRTLPVSHVKPANPIRSVMRMFCSDVEDKPWWNDRDFWRRYLTRLATERFNRFNLTLGLGYDFTREIRDCYLHFAYPFLLSVPGYEVRATNLPDAERDRNLEMLRFVADEATLRGLDFQLGLWTHAWEWTDSPHANHRIEGLNAENHAAYCRDALKHLLEACPNVRGVTLRTHGESGISERSYEFWKIVFDGVARAGRPVEIDLHAKGLDARTIDLALATRQPVVISPKFWAEHMGLPYHQAWIRPTERPDRERGDGLFANSAGSRSFLRYGYGDLMAEDRRYGILHRLWPGTQRLLLWGDPLYVAEYSRASRFCSSQGCEVMEPLSFKGRKGSGQPGPRTGYADEALVPKHDFEKYLYTYRLWGRLLYDPDVPPETWRRQLRRDYGRAATAVEGALATGSRILPLVTTAHTPSAANNHWWPEMPVHMSMTDASNPRPFTDTPSPKRFGFVSPLDPQLFARVDDFAAALVEGRPEGRYTPAEVAASLDEWSAATAKQLAEARAGADKGAVAFRLFDVDTAVVADLGRFWADKLRAATLIGLFERTGDETLRAAAVARYRSAREVWARIVEATRGVYMTDVSYGIAWYQRGHWADRTEALDKDIAALESYAVTAPSVRFDAERTKAIVAAVARPTARPSLRVRHTPPAGFRRGQPVTVEISVAEPVASIRLFHRAVDQAQAWKEAPMTRAGSGYSATITDTDTPFPLQYYFELVAGSPAAARLQPGFGAQWTGQPYYVVRQDR